MKIIEPLIKYLLLSCQGFHFYSADIRSNEVVRERLEVINHLINDREATIITTIDGCMDKLVPQDIFRKNTINIKTVMISTSKDYLNDL